MDIDNLYDYLCSGAELGRREFRLVVIENPIEGGLSFMIHPMGKDGVTMDIKLIPEGGTGGSDAQSTHYSGEWDDYSLEIGETLSVA